MTAVKELDKKPDCRVSLETYNQYPLEYTEYYREILGSIINPYRELNVELGFPGQESSIILSSRGRAKAKITEFPVNAQDDKRPYAVYYSSRGSVASGEIQTGIFAGKLLEITPPSLLAYRCMRVDNFLHKVGSLANWTVTGEFEKAGCKIQIEYPRLPN